MIFTQLTWILAAAAVCSGFLWRFFPDERRRILATWLLIVLSGGFRIAAESLGVPWLVFVSRAFAELAGVQICAMLLFKVVLGRWQLPLIARDLAVGVSYLAVIFRLLSRLGTDVNGLIATSTVVTAIIGLSMQDMLVNSVGGIVLQLEREIAHGQYITTEHGSGWVRKVRTRFTAIETSDSDLILIPNHLLNKGAVTLVSKSHRIVAGFNLPYDHLPTNIIEIVQSALRGSAIEGVADEPKPTCIVRHFHPGYVEYGILAWLTKPGHQYQQISDIHTRAYFALTRAGIPLKGILHGMGLIAPPSSGPSDGSTAVSLATLRGNDVFRGLTPVELELLAKRLKRVSFAPGETIVRQGDEGHSLYMVVKGRLRVLVSADQGRSEQIAVLEPGSLFGEMSLLTGDRRTASVIAADQVDCDRLDKADFAEVLIKRPELADEISRVMAGRLGLLAHTQEKLRAEPLEGDTENLLTQIQSFFGLGKKAQ